MDEAAVKVTAMLEYALSYALRGWPVLPLQPRGKVPLGALAPHGVKDATIDEATIRHWWAAQPDANIGAATGHMFFVVDVDPRHSGDTTLADLEKQYGALPATVECVTGGGGRHLYFRLPEGSTLPGKLGNGLDIKSTGGYVVLPPSRHPSGSSYSWEVSAHPDDVPLAAPPNWLLALAAKASVAPAGHAQVDHIPAGRRNSALASMAGSMRRRGMTLDAIEAGLLMENAQRCDPPLDEAEVRRIAASIARYNPAEPAGQSRDLLTDLGNMLRFVSQHGDDLRFCPGIGWLAWDGRRWCRDDDGAPMRMAKVVALELFDEGKNELQRAIGSLNVAQMAAAAGGSAAREAAEQMQAAYRAAQQRLAWAEKSQSRQRLEAMVALAQSEAALVVHVADLDADAWLLNCANGTLDLRSGILREHRREDLITKLAPVDYDPTTPATRWQAHLETFLPDADVRRQVQRDLGLSLVGADLEEILPIWYGTGGNGKSTTLRILGAVLGDYSQMAAPKLLTASKYERHPTELAELRGSRLVFSVETAEGCHLDEERVKMLTGGERIRAHFMRQDNVEFDASWIIVLVTNHEPGIAGADNGIWRRVRLVPWTVSLPKGKQRPQDDVVGELLTEGGAILAWMAQGLRDWQSDRQWMAGTVKAATESYHDEQDTLAGFLDDCCEIGPRYVAAVGDLYEAYSKWCEKSSEEPLRKDGFGKRLSSRGFTKGRAHHERTRIWQGLRLRTGADGESIPPENPQSQSLVDDHTETPSAVVRTATDVADCIRCGLPTRLRTPTGGAICSQCREATGVPCTTELKP